ncbi:MAG: hypothetical protein QXP31_05645 [Pyrobaculum sp.]
MSELCVGFIMALMQCVVLAVLERRARGVLRGLAAEFAYMAVVGTSIVHPRSLLRARVVDVLSPEVVSYLALRIAGDDLDVYTNSVVGVKVGGVPRCELLGRVLPELGQLCALLRRHGGRRLYEVVSDVVVPLAVSASAAGLEEGDILLNAYRAAAMRRERDLDAALRYFSRWYLVARF